MGSNKTKSIVAGGGQEYNVSVSVDDDGQSKTSGFELEVVELLRSGQSELQVCELNKKHTSS